MQSLFLALLSFEIEVENYKMFREITAHIMYHNGPAAVIFESHHE